MPETDRVVEVLRSLRRMSFAVLFLKCHGYRPKEIAARLHADYERCKKKYQRVELA